jgi:hypothetical protein
MPRPRLIIALSAVCAILFIAPRLPRADAYGLTLTSLAVYDVASGPTAGQAQQFDWRKTQQIGLAVDFQLAGQFQDVQKLKVFAVIKNAAGDVVFKSKEDYWVYAGAHGYEYKPALATADYFGTQRFTVELEASMKGFDTIQRQLDFTLAGPPLPQVSLEGLTLEDHNGHRQDIFGPGDDFALAARFKVAGNELAAPLQLIVATEDDAAPEPRSLKDIADGYAADSTDVYSLAPHANGTWTISAAGQAPQCFTGWQQQYHPFRVYAVLRAGKTVLAGDSRFGVFFDPRAEAARKGRPKDRRSCSVAAPGRWGVKAVQ